MHEVNSCGGVIGEIKLRNDTIHLVCRDTNSELCNSVEFRVFTYKIRNDSNTKYHFVW